MIEINGKRLDLESKTAKSGFKKLELAIKDSWDFLQERHELDKGKKISMLMFDKFKRKRQISAMDGESFTTVKQYPAGTQIGLNVEINYEGTPYQVRYFNNKKTTNIEGVFTYEPASLMITSEQTYGMQDKELILFMYMFSPLIKNSPFDELTRLKGLEEFDRPYTIMTKSLSKFYFDDKLVLAQNKNEKRNMVARATVMLEDLGDDKVKNFAERKGINTNSHMDIVRDKIITLLEKKGKLIFNELSSFITNYDDSYFGIEELVKSASRKKLIKGQYRKEKGEDTIGWFYVKNGSVTSEIMTHVGDKPMLSAVITYMSSNKEALAKLRDEHHKISK